MNYLKNSIENVFNPNDFEKNLFRNEYVNFLQYEFHYVESCFYSTLQRFHVGFTPNIGVRAIFCKGGRGGEPFAPKKISQVAQIFTKQSKRNEGHTMH